MKRASMTARVQINCRRRDSPVDVLLAIVKRARAGANNRYRAARGISFLEIRIYRPR